MQHDVRLHPIEGDGCRPQLLLYLSRKAGVTSCEGVHIPDTVVFEHNCPRSWYYYDSVLKEIRRRQGKDLDHSCIYEHLSERVSFNRREIDVVATYTYCVEDEHGQTVTTIDYLTCADLEKFLKTNSERKRGGILQRFVVGSEPRHSVFQASWSPRVCLVKRRTSNKPMAETYLSACERFVTFDGPDHFSSEGVCAAHTERMITATCERIVDHFCRLEHMKIANIVLYFKIDRSRVPSLLFCGSVRVVDPHFSKAPVMQLNPRFHCQCAEIQDSSAVEEELRPKDALQFELCRDDVFKHLIKRQSSSKNRGASPKKKAAKLGIAASGDGSEESGNRRSLTEFCQEDDQELADRLELFCKEWYNVTEEIKSEYRSLKHEEERATSIAEDTLYQAFSHYQSYNAEQLTVVFPPVLSNMLDGGDAAVKDLAMHLKLVAVENSDGQMVFQVDRLSTAPRLPTDHPHHPIPTMISESQQWVQDHFAHRFEQLKVTAVPFLEIGAVKIARDLERRGDKRGLGGTLLVPNRGASGTATPLPVSPKVDGTVTPNY